MITLTLGEVIAITGGQANALDDRQLEIKRIVIDSRQDLTQALFIALQGERVDGHDFVEQVIQHGALAAMVERPMSPEMPHIVVKDCRLAMGQLAQAIRQKSNAKVVALTGSSGKTTVKEMTASILTLLGKTLYTEGNFNNDLGVPLTLFRAEADDDFAVIELGANHRYEIEYTAAIVQPEVALVNNIAEAHLEGFGSLEGVAQAKGEIFSGLKANGIALVNLNSYSDQWQAHSDHHPSVRWMTFSDHHSTADFYASAIRLGENTEFTLTTPSGSIEIQLPLLGRHNVSNAVAASALAWSVGADLQTIQIGLAQLHPVKGRLYRHRLNDRITLIDDSYNANVGSMMAAIDLLATCDGFRCLVVGDMGELGENAQACHQKIGRYAQEKQIDFVVSVGTLSSAISQEVPLGVHVATIDEAILPVFTAIQSHPKVTILIKGSRSAKMERWLTQFIDHVNGLESNHREG